VFTDSRVELSWDVAASTAVPEDLRARLLRRLASRIRGGVVTVVASESRSQLHNRAAAIERLVELLRDAAAPPPPPRRPTRPSRGAREQRLAGKRRRGEIKRTRRPPGAE